MYTGVSGSGKSMMAKQEIGFVGLNTNHDIIVVDPEREYCHRSYPLRVRKCVYHRFFQIAG